ncbi:hypothetical protein LWI28_029185 [Acer negundo]|uniref:Uncharacterized protein n=1 Tax=Acer negundo TaxID=4023 RepID=A0AAD5NP83_ACENE|nr:hypothetical protein LWI28_029185 [Acer negundo]
MTYEIQQKSRKEVQLAREIRFSGNVNDEGNGRRRRKQNKKPSLGFWSWKEKKKKSTLLCLSFYNESETCGGFLYLSPVLPVGTSSVQVHIN